MIKSFLFFFSLLTIFSAALFIPDSLMAQARTRTFLAGKSFGVISKKYSLVYQKDNMESYQTGMFSYGFSGSFNGLNLEGNGQKAIVVSTQNALNDTSVLSFLSPATFSPIWELKAGGYDSLQVITQVSNAQITGSSDPEFMVWRSEEGNSRDSLYFQIFSGFSQKPLFSARQNNDLYLAPLNLMDNSSAWNDLTGDGLLEFCRVKTDLRSMTVSITVYNDLKAIDTVYVPLSSILSTVSFSNDLNSDGKPEILFSNGSGISLFQWNSDSKRFGKLASLSSVISIYSIPVNVDSDSEKEIIALSSTSDSIYIYSKDFQEKRAITIKDKKISNFIIANLNGSSNSQIIVSASGSESYLPSTYVFNLSTGDQPVWTDNSFSTLGAFDLLDKGYSQLFGVSRNGSVTELLDGANGFKPFWQIKTNNITSAGPYVPGKLFAFGLAGGFIQMFNPDIRPVDLNNDGNKEIIVALRDTNNTAVYAVLESNGTIEDTLLSISDPGMIYTQAYDFTNNSYPEIIISQSPIFGQGESKTWILEMQTPQGITGIKEPFNDFYLNQNYPNPFNPSTTISYNLPEQSSVELKVFDMLGREITTLVNKVLPKGQHSIQFNAEALSSGIYIYRMKAGQQILTRKMIIAK